MFDIGFGELLLVMVIGLVVLGPERLPVAVKTVAGWIRALRSLASSVQNELSQELKLQELQDSLKKVEKAGLQNLTPELKASMDELKEAAESLKRSYHVDNDDPSKTIHHQQVSDPEAVHDDVAHADAVLPASVTNARSESAVETLAKKVDSAATVKAEQAPAMQAIQEPVAEKSAASQQPSSER